MWLPRPISPQRSRLSRLSATSGDADRELPTERAAPSVPPVMPVLGLRANLGQFLLLVLINAFVGAMVGLERSTVPLLGERVFGLASTTAALSFIVSFGVVKALAN